MSQNPNKTLQNCLKIKKVEQKFQQGEKRSKSKGDRIDNILELAVGTGQVRNARFSF